MKLRDISKLSRFVQDLKGPTYAFEIHTSATRISKIIPQKKFTKKSCEMPNQKITQSRAREHSQTKQEFIKKHPNPNFLIHNL